MLVIAPMLESLRTVGNWVYFTSPLSQQTNHIVVCAFVDETALISGNFRTHHYTIEEVMSDIQETLHIWEGGPKTTEGVIVPEKIRIYPISFKWDTQG